MITGKWNRKLACIGVSQAYPAELPTRVPNTSYTRNLNHPIGPEGTNFGSLYTTLGFCRIIIDGPAYGTPHVYNQSQQYSREPDIHSYTLTKNQQSNPIGVCKRQHHCFL